MNPLPEFLRPLEFATSPLPYEAIAEAIARREESTPHLLQAIEWADAHPDEANEGDQPYMLHIFALFVLAQFRETQALPLVIRFFQNPQAEELTGGIFDEWVPRILASTCGDDLAPIQAMIEDDKLDAFVRTAAVMALGVLVHTGVKSRAEISAYFSELFALRLRRRPSQVWSSLIAVCTDLGMAEHLAEIQLLFLDDIADPYDDTLETIEVEIAKPSGTSDRVRWEAYTLIDDAITEMENWESYEYADEDELSEEFTERWFEAKRSLGPELPAEFYPPTFSLPIVRSEPKIGRNDLCPCGSGKKVQEMLRRCMTVASMTSLFRVLEIVVPQRSEAR